MNKNKQKAYDKAYRKANKETIRAQKKLYYQANKEKLKAYYRLYYKANLEKERARSKALKKANPDKNRQRERKHRALKHRTQVQPINEKAVFMRDGWICQICHKRVDRRFKHPSPMSASLDHITPLSKGGMHIYKNVQLAHLVCNTGKKDRLLPQGEQMRIF